MRSLVKHLVESVLGEAKRKKVAIYAGGFKPPTRGHFEVAERALKEIADLDEFIIAIGSKERDGITQGMSYSIWDNVYKQYLPKSNRVNIVETSSPIGFFYSYVKEFQDEDIVLILGQREGEDGDEKDNIAKTSALKKNPEKYSNVEVKIIKTQHKSPISGSKTRDLLRQLSSRLRNHPDFKNMGIGDVASLFDTNTGVGTALQNSFPPKIGIEGIAKILRLLKIDLSPDKPTPPQEKPIKDPSQLSFDLNEGAESINYKQKIVELTKHMLDQGKNIKPLPKVVFKDDEAEASDFFGKTAYYQPDTQTIVLYVKDRHPKDIVRSFSHEMIHHIQNLEDRLGQVTTTDTNEDDDLDKIEREAYLDGNMTFRNWSDEYVGNQMAEEKKKDPFGLTAYARELALLREDEGEYKVYLDMDGVVADFNKRFEDLAGMPSNEFEAKYGKDAFWEFIDEGDNKIKFWVGIPPMPNADKLVSYINSNFDYEMLTAPSQKKQSLIGKTVWIKKWTNKGLFPSKPKINFKAAKNKHKIKAELTKFDILIDDKASTIDTWNEAGGTGILYLNAEQVIKELENVKKGI